MEIRGPANQGTNPRETTGEARREASRGMTCARYPSATHGWTSGQQRQGTPGRTVGQIDVEAPPGTAYASGPRMVSTESQGIGTARDAGTSSFRATTDAAHATRPSHAEGEQSGGMSSASGDSRTTGYAKHATWPITKGAGTATSATRSTNGIPTSHRETWQGPTSAGIREQAHHHNKYRSRSREDRRTAEGTSLREVEVNSRPQHQPRRSRRTSGDSRSPSQSRKGMRVGQLWRSRTWEEVQEARGSYAHWEQRPRQWLHPKNHPQRESREEDAREGRR